MATALLRSVISRIMVSSFRLYTSRSSSTPVYRKEVATAVSNSRVGIENEKEEWLESSNSRMTCRSSTCTLHSWQIQRHLRMRKRLFWLGRTSNADVTSEVFKMHEVIKFIVCMSNMDNSARAGPPLYHFIFWLIPGEHTVSCLSL